MAARVGAPPRDGGRRVRFGAGKGRVSPARALFSGRGTAKAGSAATSKGPGLPASPEAAADAAGAAVAAAIRDGRPRVLVKFVLPVDQRKMNYLSTESSDFPCSVRDEYFACETMVKRMVGRVCPGQAVTGQLSAAVEGGFSGDIAGTVAPADRSVVCAVYPSAELWKKVAAVAERQEANAGATVLCNPQWNLTGGQVINDFGIGPWKKRAEAFVDSFEPAYVLEEIRVGDASGVVGKTYGGVVRLLRAYPDQATYVYLLSGTASGRPELIETLASRPSYAELAALLKGLGARDGDSTLLPKQPRGGGGGSAAVDTIAETDLAAFRCSAADLECADKQQLWLLCNANGLPTSGRLDALRRRLLDAWADADASSGSLS